MSNINNKSNSRKKHPLRTRRRFRLSFINENTFNEIWTIRLSQRKVIALITLLIVALGSMIATLIVFTPLKTLLPGYLKQSQRQEYIVNSMRVDSMITQLRVIDAYADNFKKILLDSIDIKPVAAMAENTSALLDSMTPQSESERQFIKQYDASNRYNVNILSSIAAEGLSLHNPASTATIVSKQQGNEEFTLLTPNRVPVLAMHEGTVIDTYHSIGDGHTVTIQHPDGLLSKYSGISSIFVEKGTKVSSGTSVGIMASTTNRPETLLTIEIWNKGTKLNPQDYLQWE